MLPNLFCIGIHSQPRPKNNNQTWLSISKVQTVLCILSRISICLPSMHLHQANVLLVQKCACIAIFELGFFHLNSLETRISYERKEMNMARDPTELQISKERILSSTLRSFIRKRVENVNTQSYPYAVETVMRLQDSRCRQHFQQLVIVNLYLPILFASNLTSLLGDNLRITI